jgi:pimeloyl-ACP methyl ester carboxylesterase
MKLRSIHRRNLVLGTVLGLASAVLLPVVLGTVVGLVYGDNVSARTRSPAAKRPGSLVSSEPRDAKVAEAEAFNLRYRSTSVDGRSIEVTGVAYVPKGTPPKGGWPVVSIGHATTGMADICAPSRSISFLETNIAKQFVTRGIAVVQSDYEGLGTPQRHPYLVGESEGRGVLDMVRAARNLPGGTVSNRVVVWGHSQGGHAALFAGQLAARYAPELKMLGVVAGAPPSDLASISSIQDTGQPRGLLFMLIAGFAAANPALKLDAVLTASGQQALASVDTGCTDDVSKAYATGLLSKYLVPGGLGSGPWKNALVANEPGHARVGAPVLIVHGDADELVPVGTSDVLTKRLCAMGDVVERKVYPGASHGGAALVSLGDVNRFIDDRFAGKKSVSTC